jgi:hypothetical protein
MLPVLERLGEPRLPHFSVWPRNAGVIILSPLFWCPVFRPGTQKLGLFPRMAVAAVQYRDRSNRFATSATWCLAAALVLLAVLPGCVRRRMTVRSNPPGAVVFVDDQEIGTTPASTAFTYYGTRKIQLVKDGFETLTVKQTFYPPWYEITPLDFVSENLWPHETRDEQYLDFQLQPQQIVPSEKLVERAEALRGGIRQGYTVPLPNATPTPQPIAPLPN